MENAPLQSMYFREMGHRIFQQVDFKDLQEMLSVRLSLLSFPS
jgi:hypothetical protein